MDGQPFNGSGFTTVSAAETSFRCTSTCAQDFPAGTTLRLDFKTMNAITPFSHWRLAGWRGPCATLGDSCNITLDQDATVTAIVEVHPRLIVTVHKARVAAGGGTFIADRDSVSLSSHDETGAFVLELGES